MSLENVINIINENKLCVLLREYLVNLIVLNLKSKHLQVCSHIHCIKYHKNKTRIFIIISLYLYLLKIQQFGKEIGDACSI